MSVHKDPPAGMRGYGIGNKAEPLRIAWKLAPAPWTDEDERAARLRVSLGR